MNGSDPLSTRRLRNTIGCSYAWKGSKDPTFLSPYAKDWGRWARTAMSRMIQSCWEEGGVARGWLGIYSLKGHSFAASFAHSDLQRLLEGIEAPRPPFHVEAALYQVRTCTNQSVSLSLWIFKNVLTAFQLCRLFCAVLTRTVFSASSASHLLLHVFFFLTVPQLPQMLPIPKYYPLFFFLLSFEVYSFPHLEPPISSLSVTL